MRNKEKVAANTSGANAVSPLQLLTSVTRLVSKKRKKVQDKEDLG